MAERYFLFHGTPSRLRLDWIFARVFGTDALRRPEFRPRALFDRVRMEVIATTEGPLDTLDRHQAIHDSGWHVGLGAELARARFPACSRDWPLTLTGHLR